MSKPRRSVFDIKPQPDDVVSVKNASRDVHIFNWFGWRTWFIGFLIPVFALGIVPFGRLMTDREYTGTSWFCDIFGDTSMAIISFSMMLAAMCEIITRNRIGKSKTSFAHILETFLFIVAFICIGIYITITTVEAGWDKELLTERLFLQNIILFITALVLGTFSFTWRILWNLH